MLSQVEQGPGAVKPVKPVFFAWPKSLSKVLARLLALSLFCAILFIFYTIYNITVREPLPYSRVPKSPLVVRLRGYGTFKGTQVLRHWEEENISFDEPVDAWLGINYAAPPVGAHRFAPPNWPEVFNGTKDAQEYGPTCGQSEDCLNFNIFRTPGVPLSTKLPVMVFLHGGGFVSGNGRSIDGGVFVSRSKEPLMIVLPQYRISALGSLPSALFEEEGLLNLGLLDQRQLLKFVQKYISAFGGDRHRVTLSGQSAGAHSVGIHQFHNYGDDKGQPLFSQAILASGAPTARTFPNATSPLYQQQFEEFMEYLTCPVAPNAEALECLKKVDVSWIRSKQTQMYRKYAYNITWPFQPVSPGPILEKRGSTSGEEGTFWKVPTLISSATDEGNFFAPKNIQTSPRFLEFLQGMNPGITEEDLNDLEMMYMDPNDPDSPYHKSPISTQFKRISAAYGDYSYICPIQETAHRLAKAGVPVYKARWNTPNHGEDWRGATHASDADYFQGSPSARFPEIADLYSSYWASFVVSGNPNTHAIAGAPTWEVYEGVGTKQLVVGSMDGTGTKMEDEADGVRMEACAWWRDEERMKRLNK